MKKVVLITGASSGLGKKIAENLVSSKKYKVYSLSREKGDTPKEVTFYKADITKDADCKRLISEIVKRDGRLDILINNAGYSLSGPSMDFSSKALLEVIDTNAVGAFRLMREVFPIMKGNKWGRIVNITSLNAIVPLPNFGLYSASKHALEALGQALRYEVIKDGIFVTNVAPGAISAGTSPSRLLSHKPAREKFKVLYLLMPMIKMDEVARKVVEVVESSKPPARLVLGKDAQITFFLQRFMPQFIWDKLMNFVWSKK